jgi:hypothetical protein
VIDDIRKRERDGAVEPRRLRVGARVQILSGPFRNQLGLCSDMNGAQRVSVLLNFVGGQHEVRLRDNAVEPVDNEGASSRLPQRPIRICHRRHLADRHRRPAGVRAASARVLQRDFRPHLLQRPYCRSMSRQPSSLQRMMKGTIAMTAAWRHV